MTDGKTTTVETHTGERVEITHVGTQGEGARIDVAAADGRRWRLDVTRQGEYEIVTRWNSDGELDDVPVPDWMDSIVSRMRAL